MNTPHGWIQCGMVLFCVGKKLLSLRIIFLKLATVRSVRWLQTSPKHTHTKLLSMFLTSSTLGIRVTAHMGCSLPEMFRLVLFPSQSMLFPPYPGMQRLARPDCDTNPESKPMPQPDLDRKLAYGGWCVEHTKQHVYRRHSNNQITERIKKEEEKSKLELACKWKSTEVEANSCPRQFRYLDNILIVQRTFWKSGISPFPDTDEAFAHHIIIALFKETTRIRKF